jgi:hypothetical protein
MQAAPGHTSLLAMHTVLAVLSGGTVQGCLVKETDGHIWETDGYIWETDEYVWETVS